MTKKRIMLLGANGQIGQALQAEALLADWQLGVYGRDKCDITRHGIVQKTLHDFKPDLVINAAAMTAVDNCEVNQEYAVAVNFEGPANLAAQCAVMDIPLIHISTDYVFDGKDGVIPYRPDDVMNPLNIYGNTKMMGEESIRHEHAWHVILRISSVFSSFGNNLLTRMLHAIDTSDEVKAVTDQKCCPTYAPDVAKALVLMTDTILHGKSDGFGTFHLCGEPAATRLEFTQAVIKAYTPYALRNPKITPLLSRDLFGADRPAYSVLDCSKIHKIYSIAQKPWKDGLDEALKLIAAAKMDESSASSYST